MPFWISKARALAPPSKVGGFPICKLGVPCDCAKAPLQARETVANAKTKVRIGYPHSVGGSVRHRWQNVETVWDTSQVHVTKAVRPLSADRHSMAVRAGEGGTAMRSLRSLAIIGLAILILSAAAVAFFVWLFWLLPPATAL